MPEFWKPSVASDLVIFGVDDDGKLHLLLVERGKEPFKGMLAFPGGFLSETDEDMEACALRELQEETGLTGVSLEQLKIRSQKNRDPRQNRVISVPFIGLAEGLPLVVGGDDAAAAKWVLVETLTKDSLAFDHFSILNDALGFIADRLNEEPDQTIESLSTQSRI